MANEEFHPAKKIYPAHGDAIRIMPLHVPDTVHADRGRRHIKKLPSLNARLGSCQCKLFSRRLRYFL